MRIFDDFMPVWQMVENYKRKGKPFPLRTRTYNKYIGGQPKEEVRPIPQVYSLEWEKFFGSGLPDPLLL